MQRSILLQVQIKVNSRNKSGKPKKTLLLFLRSVSNQIHAWVSSLPAHWPELKHQKDNLQCPGESPVLDQLQLRQKQSSDEVVLSISKPSHPKLHLFTGANLKYQIYEILLQNKSQPFPVCDAITTSQFLIQHLVILNCTSNRVTGFTSTYRMYFPYFFQIFCSVKTQFFYGKELNLFYIVFKYQKQ